MFTRHVRAGAAGSFSVLQAWSTVSSGDNADIREDSDTPVARGGVTCDMAPWRASLVASALPDPANA